MDRRWRVVMLSLGENADIKAWYHWLVEECDLQIGQDWHWSWHDNRWAVEFKDPKIETKVRLMLRDQ